MISLSSKVYIAAEDSDYCEWCACKNIECKCVKKKCMRILNSHAKEYKKQATILIIKDLKMFSLME
jgi:hypothetical protein